MSEPGKAVLEYRGVTKRFAKDGPPAVDAISLDVLAGRVTGLAGPDGAGKTTLIRLAAGLLVPESGTVSVLGLDAERDPLEIRGKIGYMPQQFGLYQDLTVRENLELYADLQGVDGGLREERFEKLLAMSGLRPYTGRLAGKLSGGMKQKLGLSCSLIKSPGLLLLDEPTVGVDPVSRRELWDIVYQLVNEDGIGVLLATAYLDEVDRCQQVFMLERGQVVDVGPPEHFHRQVAGRVFVLNPAAEINPRTLQSAAMRAEGVIDATIRSGRVRCVLKAEAGRECLETGQTGPLTSEMEEGVPNFEDAFMALARHHEIHIPEADPETQSAANAERKPAIVVKDLVKRFGDFAAVQGINFSVAPGEVFGLLGPNGAGKTTTFRMLCGLMRVSEGEVLIAGRDLRHSPSEARSRLGYMAQQFSLYRQLSVLTNLKFYGQAYGLHGRRLRERIDWALEEFDLKDRRRDDAEDLPGGYRQRLAMATAMLHDPDILFLDEPTSGADPLARREFWLRINGFAQQGVTVLVTTHFMEEAEYCDRMIIMSRGTELAHGRPAEIRELVRSDEHTDPTIEDAFVVLARRAQEEAGE
ncbi:ATP-binding cassette domain-containing protein [Ruficoccus sp. ZRK36]|uniref:ATP-binding cassette domain-containing protein n=1 Tax=Ruficoccus sp. ZRK36 TaxID=2866311 RepID=UPI001C72AD3B|nr:ATP-binding cassette domain-containing protein [Ruficoccus sp. ZRK36]QYY35072.1 ATP-binding cassette domain-containing protein [Ruficoccus sp. ZRK36]